MNRILAVRVVILFFGLIMASCSAPEMPYFERVKSMEITKATSKSIEIKGETIWVNPNGFGINLLASHLDVYVDDIYVGEMDQEYNIEIKANDSFIFPFLYSFPTSEILKEKGILQSTIFFLKTKILSVRYLGTMTLDVKGLEVEVPVDIEDDILLD